MASRGENPNPIRIVYSSIQSQPPARVEYPKKFRYTAKWLSVAQLLLALVSVYSQSATTALHEHYANTMATSDVYPLSYLTDVDSKGIGIWIGLIIIVAAAIGIAAARQNRKSLIITHLVLNVFAMILSVALVGTSADPIYEIASCRRRGIYMMPRKYNPDGPQNVTIFDEVLYIRYSIYRIPTNEFRNYFYCKHALFLAWIACSCILLISSLMMFIISLTLLVLNSNAACLRCCSTYFHQDFAYCCCFDPYPSAPTARLTYQPEPSVQAQIVVNGPQVASTVYVHPAAQSTSQASAPVMYSNALYNQAFLL